MSGRLVGSGAGFSFSGAFLSPCWIWVIDFDRNDVDRQRLDVGDLEGARRRQREQAEAEQRRVHDHRCREAGLHPVSYCPVPAG